MLDIDEFIELITVYVYGKNSFFIWRLILHLDMVFSEPIADILWRLYCVLLDEEM